MNKSGKPILLEVGNTDADFGGAFPDHLWVVPDSAMKKVHFHDAHSFGHLRFFGIPTLRGVKGSETRDTPATAAPGEVSPIGIRPLWRVGELLRPRDRVRAPLGVLRDLRWPGKGATLTSCLFLLG